jgi:hypothetical protein
VRLVAYVSCVACCGAATLCVCNALGQPPLLALAWGVGAWVACCGAFLGFCLAFEPKGGGSYP